MANLAGKNASGTTVYLGANGAGTDQDPHILKRSTLARRTLTLTPTLSAPGSYATGDYVGTSTTPASAASAVSAAGAIAQVLSVTVLDRTTHAASLELWLFDATFTAPTDNAAWSLSDADAAKVVAVIPISGYSSYANGGVHHAPVAGSAFKLTGTALYYALVNRDVAKTWASGDLTVTLVLEEAA